MTSREFIQRQFGNADGNSKSLSSIYKDKNGQIYSYGSHYPLLFKVGGLTFRNVSGYSNTTGKHIGWCYGFDAIDVKLTGCNQYTWRNLENGQKVPSLLNARTYGDTVTDEMVLKAILADLETEQREIAAEMNTKTRHDTQVFANLVRELDGTIASIKAVRKALR